MQSIDSTPILTVSLDWAGTEPIEQSVDGYDGLTVEVIQQAGPTGWPFAAVTAPLPVLVKWLREQYQPDAEGILDTLLTATIA